MRKLVFCLMSPNPWKQTTADEKRQGLQSNILFAFQSVIKLIYGVDVYNIEYLYSTIGL